jgi:hypothetical protein
MVMHQYTSKDFLCLVAVNYTRLKKDTHRYGQEFLHDAILKISEHIDRGQFVHTSDEQTLNLLKHSSYNNSKNDKRKATNRKAHLEEFHFVLNQAQRVSHQQADDPLIQRVEVENLYELVMSMAFESFSFFHAAIFKSYIVNRIGFRDLARQTG